MLAADPDMQVAYLRSLDVGDCCDELALDYDAIAAAATDMLYKGELNTEQRDCVVSLNDYLTEISGAANAHLWTFEALGFSEEWQRVRTMAGNCLSLLHSHG